MRWLNIIDVDALVDDLICMHWFDDYWCVCIDWWLLMRMHLWLLMCMHWLVIIDMYALMIIDGCIGWWLLMCCFGGLR